jgi:hypothetical protein
MNNLKHKSATFVVYNTKSVVFTTLMARIQMLCAIKLLSNNIIWDTNKGVKLWREM